MNRNSVRNRPTPSAPYSSALAASAGLPTLASSGMRWPSLVEPGLPRQFLGCGRAGLGGFGCGDLLFGRVDDQFALGRIDDHGGAVGRFSASAAETTATMPRARARMAVCEVGPPCEVTMARVLLMSSAAVSAGERSSATSTNGVSLCGRPGAGAPIRSAITRWPTSCRSAARSA